MAQEKELPLGLYWKDKRTTVDRTVLPFQSLEVIETINESRATREREKTGSGMAFNFESPSVDDANWRNKLIWGDNRYVMAALLEKFSGKIDLIYIDPPFATGANFSTTVAIGEDEVEHTKEASAMEELAYRDTWGKGLDSFLQMMYDRLVLMRELMSEKASIYVHLDWRVSHYVKLIMDEIFGYDCFLNNVVWCYQTRQFSKRYWNKKHDDILVYSRKYNNHCFNWDVDGVLQPYSEATIAKYKLKDENGFYRLCGRGITGSPIRSAKDVDPKWEKTHPELVVRNYLGKGFAPHDYWLLDIVNQVALERTDYPTQKPEAIIERIVKASSNPGDLVADFFCGSGTTAAVAEKNNRRWIMADLGRFAIHTSRKRMLGIDNCKPFEILNIGKYERQYWQGVTFGNKTPEQTLAEYIVFILKLYKAESLPGSTHIHGRKGNKLVHVGSVEAPVTFADIQNALQETIRRKQKDLVVLGWEWEMGLHDVVEQEAKKAGIKLSLLSIPREVMDRRATDAGDVQFFELAYLETELKETKDGIVIKLEEFVIPNLDLIPAEVK
ncbi:TPA: site-specific DNA-methyltransferase, partial [Candidatus Wolfebacteria bacterium]|nr:site-specific DNA-methyltransferase [Candidatus Wolfebacteria bacterium]